MGAAVRCDVCGKLQVAPEPDRGQPTPLPADWFYVDIQPGGRSASKESAEVCSRECAGRWVTEVPLPTTATDPVE